jgi:hypothetical protein
VLCLPRSVRGPSCRPSCRCPRRIDVRAPP